MAEEGAGESKPHIIIDNGTGYCKAGLSGEEGPTAVFPACVGYPKYASGMVGGDKKEFFVGADAEAKRGVGRIACLCIEPRGTITGAASHKTENAGINIPC